MSSRAIADTPRAAATRSARRRRRGSRSAPAHWRVQEDRLCTRVATVPSRPCRAGLRQVVELAGLDAGDERPPPGRRVPQHGAGLGTIWIVTLGRLAISTSRSICSAIVVRSPICIRKGISGCTTCSVRSPDPEAFWSHPITASPELRLPSTCPCSRQLTRCGPVSRNNGRSDARTLPACLKQCDETVSSTGKPVQDRAAASGTYPTTSPIRLLTFWTGSTSGRRSWRLARQRAWITCRRPSQSPRSRQRRATTSSRLSPTCPES
jgi:hypothetical protein